MPETMYAVYYLRMKPENVRSRKQCNKNRLCL